MLPTGSEMQYQGGVRDWNTQWQQSTRDMTTRSWIEAEPLAVVPTHSKGDALCVAVAERWRRRSVAAFEQERTLRYRVETAGGGDVKD